MAKKKVDDQPERSLLEAINNDYIDERWADLFPGKPGYSIVFANISRALEGLNAIDELLRAQRVMQANDDAYDEDAEKDRFSNLMVEQLANGQSALISFVSNALDSVAENLRKHPMAVPQ